MDTNEIDATMLPSDMAWQNYLFSKRNEWLWLAPEIPFTRHLFNRNQPPKPKAGNKHLTGKL
jgi:hypothetical protein